METKQLVEGRQTMIRRLSEVRGVTLKAENDGIYFEFDKTADLDAQVLPNFKLGEFLTKNKADSFTRIHVDVAVEAQIIRNAWGSGITFNSTYRNEAYNKKVGGAKMSQHKFGRALDTKPTNGDIAGYKKKVLEVKKSGGIGFYPNFVHIDTGRTRRW